MPTKDPIFPPLSDEVINAIESKFGRTLHEIEPLGSGEYAMYELGIGCSLYITTYYNHTLVRLGYTPKNAVVYSHCNESRTPDKVVASILHCMQQLYKNNVENQRGLRRYIGEQPQ